MTVQDEKKSPDELEREIDQTRAQINYTMDAIQAKLSPGQLIDQVLGYFRSSSSGSSGKSTMRGVSEYGSNLGTSLRNNPVPVALIGTGIAWLMTSGSSHSRSTHEGRRYYYDDEVEGTRASYGYGPAYGPDHYPDTYPETSMEEEYMGEYMDENYVTTGRDDIVEPPILPTRVTEGGGTQDDLREAAEQARARLGERGDSDSSRRERFAQGASSRAEHAKEGARRRAGQLSHSVKHRAAGARQGLGSAAARTRHGMGSVAEGTRQRMGSLAEGTRQRMGSLAEGTRHGMGSLADSTRHGFGTMVEQQPLVLAAIGVAIGAALGGGLPATRREDELMGQTRDELISQTKEIAQESAAKAQAVQQAATDAAKRQAEEENLTREQGQKAAEDMIGSGQAKVQRVAKAAWEEAKEEADRQTREERQSVTHTTK